jgi:hypothetical protein
MNTAVRTRGLAYGTIDSRRAQSHRGPRWDPSNGSRSDLVKKPRFCGFFSGGELQRFVSLNRLIDEKSSFGESVAGTRRNNVIAATTVSIAAMGIALALRPLFPGKKIPVEWMFIALWTAIAIGLAIWRRRR